MKKLFLAFAFLLLASPAFAKFSSDELTGTTQVSTPLLNLTGTGTINGLDAIDGTGETTLEAALDIAGDVDGTGLGSVDLDEAAVESELEGVLDLQDLQGAVTDGQVPNNITVDLATLATTATTATTANAGDSATAFFSSGTIEHERGGLEADVSAYDGLIGITGGAAYNVTGLTTQIIIFDGAGAPTVAALSGDATMSNAGVVAVADDSHNHSASTLNTDSVSADELNATGVESELEAVLDLSDLQGAVTDGQVPNTITIDLATTATTANAGDSATAFFSSGTIESARLPSATTSASGIAEAAIASEVDTGTDADRYVSPDALAGSNLGEKVVQMVVFDFGTDTATGDGKFYFYVPSSITGMNLVEVHAQVITAGTTNTTNVDLARCAAVTSGNACSGTVDDMLSTNLTIDSGEDSSDTAATAAVINGSNDDVATNQVIRVDVDAVHTTAAKGLIITLIFRLP